MVLSLSLSLSRISKFIMLSLTIQHLLPKIFPFPVDLFIFKNCNMAPSIVHSMIIKFWPFNQSKRFSVPERMIVALLNLKLFKNVLHFLHGVIWKIEQSDFCCSLWKHKSITIRYRYFQLLMCWYNVIESWSPANCN